METNRGKQPNFPAEVRSIALRKEGVKIPRHVSVEYVVLLVALSATRALERDRTRRPMAW